jgi:TRAP-type mannitol/chloroaromatic compound transport system permease large subunit
LILLFGALVLLLLIGAPVFVAIGGAAAIYLLANGISPLIAIQQMVSGIDSFPILAVPFFVLAGNLMNAGAVTERLYSFAHSLAGHWRGGLGHVNIIGSVIFSGMSGTAIADAGGLGTIEVKAMRDRGYDTGLRSAFRRRPPRWVRSFRRAFRSSFMASAPARRSVSCSWLGSFRGC